ncbi:hypothetical protein NliqN6_5794, partial [Naganishia liquefaciens]
MLQEINDRKEHQFEAGAGTKTTDQTGSNACVDTNVGNKQVTEPADKELPDPGQSGPMDMDLETDSTGEASSSAPPTGDESINGRASNSLAQEDLADDPPNPGPKGSARKTPGSKRLRPKDSDEAAYGGKNFKKSAK